MKSGLRTFSVTKLYGPGEVSAEHCKMLYQMTGCRNAEPITLDVDGESRAFAAGEVLLLNAKGMNNTPCGPFTITYQFQILGEADLTKLGLQ